METIGDLWTSSAHRDHERRRRELVARWYGFHSNMAELHARLSQEHAAKAERLCEDPEPRARARDRKRYAAPLPHPAARGGGHRVQRM